MCLRERTCALQDSSSTGAGSVPGASGVNVRLGSSGSLHALVEYFQRGSTSTAGVGSGAQGGGGVGLGLGGLGPGPGLGIGGGAGVGHSGSAGSAGVAAHAAGSNPLQRLFELDPGPLVHVFDTLNRHMGSMFQSCASRPFLCLYLSLLLLRSASTNPLRNGPQPQSD